MTETDKKPRVRKPRAKKVKLVDRVYKTPGATKPFALMLLTTCCPMLLGIKLGNDVKGA